MTYKFTSKSVEDTLELAQNIESEKFPKTVICLDGELGSGKTIFVKGFADALGIDDTITSPTFNLVKEYFNGEIPLFHMDVYRFDKKTNAAEFEDYFEKDAVSIIEWSDIISDSLPNERLEIKFTIIDENTRILVITPFGEQYEELCANVF